MLLSLLFSSWWKLHMSYQIIWSRELCRNFNNELVRYMSCVRIDLFLYQMYHQILLLSIFNHLVQICRKMKCIITDLLHVWSFIKLCYSFIQSGVYLCLFYPTWIMKRIRDSLHIILDKNIRLIGAEKRTIDSITVIRCHAYFSNKPGWQYGEWGWPLTNSMPKILHLLLTQCPFPNKGFLLLFLHICIFTGVTFMNAKGGICSLTTWNRQYNLKQEARTCETATGKFIVIWQIGSPRMLTRSILSATAVLTYSPDCMQSNNNNIMVLHRWRITDF